MERKLSVKLEADVKKFIVEMQKANKELKSSTSELNNSISELNRNLSNNFKNIENTVSKSTSSISSNIKNTKLDFGKAKIDVDSLKTGGKVVSDFDKVVRGSTDSIKSSISKNMSSSSRVLNEFNSTGVKSLDSSSKGIKVSSEEINRTLEGMGRNTVKNMESFKAALQPSGAERSLVELGNAANSSSFLLRDSLKLISETARDVSSETDSSFGLMSRTISSAYNNLSKDSEVSAGEVRRSFREVITSSNELNIVEKNLLLVKNSMKSVGDSASTVLAPIGKSFNMLADRGDRLKSKQSSLGGTIVRTAATFVGLNSAMSIAQASIGRVDTIHKNVRSMELMTGSNEKAKKVVNDLTKAVQGTPIALDQMMDGAKGLVSAGMEVGKVADTMNAVATASYAVGKGADSINPMVERLKIMQTTGKATYGSISDLESMGVPALRILANTFDMSVEDITEALSKGEIAGGEAVDALVNGIMKGTDGVAGETVKMEGTLEVAADTIEGAFGNMRTAIVNAFSKPFTDDTKMYDQLVGGLNGVVTMIKEDISPAISELMFKIVEIVSNNGGTIKKVFETGVAVIKGILLGSTDVLGNLEVKAKELSEAFKKYFDIDLSDPKEIERIVRKLVPLFVKLKVGIAAFNGISKAASSVRSVFETIDNITSLLNINVGKLIISFGKFAFTPVGAIVIALMAVGAYLVHLYKTSETFRETVNKVASSIWKTIKTVSTKIKDIFVKAVPIFFPIISILIKVGKKLVEFWKKFKENPEESFSKVKETIDTIVGKFDEMWEKIKKGFEKFIEGIKKIWEGFKQGVKKIYTGIKKVISTIIKGISTFIKFVAGILKIMVQIIIVPFRLVYEIIKSVFINIYNIVSTIVKGVVFVIKKIWGGIVKVAKKIWEPVKEFFVELWDGIKETTTELWEGLKEFLSETWDTIKEIADRIWTPIKEFFTKLWDGIKETTTELWEGLKEFLSETWDTIKETADRIWTPIKEFFTKLWDDIKEKTEELWEGLKEFLSETWDAIKETADRIWTPIKEFFTELWDGIKEKTEELWEGLKEFLSETWNTIKETAEEVWDSIKEFVSNTWEGMKETAEEMWNNLKEFLTEIWESIKETADNIWTPIKEFFTGLWDSIKETTEEIWGKIKKFFSRTWDNITKTTSEKWNNIKNKMTEPIDKAKENIEKAINTIKKLFKDMVLKFPKIQMPKLPHFKWTPGSIKPLKEPKLNVSWYEKGGIIDGSREGRLVGVGENHGTEAIIPLSKRSKMLPFASAISSMINSEGGSGSGNGTTVYEFNGELVVDGVRFDTDEDVRKFIERVKRITERDSKRRF